VTEAVLSQLLELDVPICSNTYGVAPCTAGVSDSGTAQAQSSLRLLASSSQYLSMAGSAATALMVATESVTVEAWFKTTNVNNSRIISVRSAANRGYELGVDAGKITSFYGTAAGGYAAPYSLANVNDGLLKHVVLVVDTALATITIYINGVFDSSSPVIAGDASHATDARLGAFSAAGPAVFWDGDFDEVRVYKRALSLAEVEAHYLGVYADESNLVGHWAFNEGTGTSAADTSGTGNTATLVNNPTWVTDLNVARTLRLRAAASATLNAYRSMTARLTGGLASVQERTISSYVGASKVATMSKRWGSNLLVRSDEFDNASWVKVLGVTVNANAATAPDGTMTADQIVFPGVTSGERIEQSPILAVDGVTYNETIWMKGSGQININIGTSTGVGGQTEPTITLTSEWQRVSATVTLSLPTGNVRCMAAIWRSGPVPTLYIWRAKLERGADIGLDADDLQTVASAIALPDATTTYSIIDRPNACYNTRKTCQDKANYTPGVSTIRFTNVGAPIDKTAPARPYISRLQRAPTELDPEEGLSRRASSSVTMVDEACADTDFDRYINTRAAAAGGTFWTRFLARTMNYAGRTARIKHGYVNQGVFGAYSTETYIVEKITGPTGSGEVTVTLKDPTKLADRSMTPTPTSGKLAAALLPSDLQIVLGSGEAAQYESAGYVRIGDEVIRYGSKFGDTLFLPSSTYRAQFGTEAAEGAIDDGVQQCKVWTDAAWSDVLHDILNSAGILDAEIDVTGIESEDDTWLGPQYRVTRCLIEPTENDQLMMELLQPAQAMLWWAPETGKVTVRVFAPRSPGTVVARTLDQSGYLMRGSVEVERLEDLRITLAAVYFGLTSAVANVEEAKSYQYGELTVDADAESAAEYDERRVKTFYVPWFGVANILAMRSHSRRYVARHRDTPENVMFDLAPKDDDIDVGDIVDLQSQNLVDEDGQIRTARVLITRKEHLGTHIKFRARVTVFDQNYGFIAPAGASNYPANNGYAVISNSAGLMSDGTAGSLII